MADTTDQLRPSTDELLDEIARLRHLDELKNEFVAMVAHDLRSPMASISGAANTLLASADRLREEDRCRLLEMIARSTARLSGLVEDVLQVARIESGQFSYDVRPFDLVTLLRRTAVEVEVGDLDGGDRITVTADEGVPLALADEERTWQVVTNLLSNALKFSPADSAVDVHVAQVGRELQATVVDRGAGIAPADLPRLFQKFSRIQVADGGGRHDGTGTGLGLYICQQIVEAQGGRIWAESRLGEGTTLRFTTPIAGA